MRGWLATYDPNLPLLDVINDPASSDLDVRLAALSLGEGLDGGYYDAEALADALAQLWSECEHGIGEDGSEARVELADLLDRAGGYSRSLYDAVKLLPPATAARHLHAHAKRMIVRADMGRIAREATRQAA